MHDAHTERLEARRQRFTVARIREMVDEFYGRGREDPELGPIFERRIDDWPHHLDRMVGFWRAVLRSEPGFAMSERGSPLALHQRIAEADLHHYERWLRLFGEVVDATFQPEDAAEVHEAAGRIASSLSRHLRPVEEP
ncbi:MAG: group III truncated hemoglobin [Myxococcota bacterium]